LLALAAGCTVRQPPSPDADPEHPYPPPHTDLVPAVGSESTLEIATWNLHNFPSTVYSATTVADLIASLDLDVVVVEEIASEDAWTELLLRLRDRDGILSTHVYTSDSYQKIGVIYRRSLVTASVPELLFDTDEYAFPRPPLAVTITVDGETIELVGVHLKAGTTPDDAVRRTQAVAQLDTFLRAQVDGGGENEVVLLGDYNERVTTDGGRTVLAPLLTAPDRYTVRTDPAAVAGGVTYLGFGGEFIDHITTTAGLETRWAAAHVELPRLDMMISAYQSVVSDHLPAIVVIPR